MLNRRQVLAGSAAAGAAVLSGCWSGRSRWEFLSEDQAATLAVLCDQIVPADDFPSASQAGAVIYIDRQLTGPYRRYRRAYRDGIEAAEKFCQSHFGIAPAHATPAQQLELVRNLERTDPAFFGLLLRHTMQSYYGSPRHGGNRDAVSWRMLGLDEPPLRGRAQYELTAGPKS
ncbi:MAG TPA: gluconate 2-dehydrogenase subunit 3 family protein [Terracidiphilus sp.]|nr:gluconate 2-dehydrogenase subunit 3 family protein [Terracidiphilus sp.]